MLSVFTIKKIRHIILTILSVLCTIGATAGPDDVPPTATITKTPNPNTLAEGALWAPTQVTVTGTAPLRYAWKRNGVLLPNDTTNAINRVFVSLSDAGTYTCLVSNAAGSVESNGYVLNVTAATGVPVPTALTNKSFTEGTNNSLTISFSGTNPKASAWQWYKNGQPIPGTDGNEQSGNSSCSYNLNNISLSAAGNYYCVLKNSKGTTITNTMTLTVTATTLPPSLGLNGNPADNILYVGDKLLLSANLSNASAIKWQKNGVDIPNSNTIPFVINSLSLADSGYYACVGSNSTGNSFTTAAAKVTVLPAAPPAISINLPDSFVVDEAGSFSIGILVAGTVTYQWQKDGVNIPTSGASANSSAQTPKLSIVQPLTMADAGYYVCRVSNNFGTTISNACKIIVVQQPIPLFVMQSTYGAGAGKIRIFLKGAGAEMYTNFFIDKIPVTVSSDGRYYMPLSLPKGAHEIKAATADGKSEIVKLVTIR